MSERPLSDADARARALDPTQSFIVQAPAGSGKTELLTQRFLCLLARVEEPEQILAITFTRKAAAEMRDRVLSALQRASEPPGEEIALPAKALTREIALDALAADARRGWQLLQHPSRLRIQTIDSINATLARRLPILSGTGASLPLADDAEPLYDAACRRIIDRLGDGSLEAHHVETLIRHLGNHLDRLAALMAEMLARRDQWLSHIVSSRDQDELRATVEGTLQALVSIELQKAHAAIPEDWHGELVELAAHASQTLLAGLDVGAKQSSPYVRGAALQRMPPADWQAIEEWQLLLRVFMTKEGGFFKRVDKRHGFPPTDRPMKTRMEQLLASLAARDDLLHHFLAIRDLPAVRYDDEQWQTLQALLEVLPLAAAELQIVFQERGEIDYVENSLRALRALGAVDEPTNLALALDYRLQHILVDEFQDTSFTQLELLERLTAGWQAGDGRTVFCVGDPMQSIYRFRQAEVGLFLNLQRSGLANVKLEPLTLRANFRSTCELVDWFNATFPPVFAAQSDVERGAVTYSPCEAPMGAPAQGGVQVHALIDADAHELAQKVVAATVQSLAETDGSIGILVASRGHLGTLLRELARAGIEYQAVEIEQLFQRPVVQDLIALTRALVHLGDRTAWLAVLRAPWCGLALADLHTIAAGDENAILWPLLRDPDVRATLTQDGQQRLDRTCDVLESALRDRSRHSLRDWVERTWLSLGGPATVGAAQDLEDAAAFLQRLEDLDVAGDLEDVAQLENQLLDLFARPQAGVRARVEVMTIHKAKGLEFDTVILPGLERVPRGEEARLLRWTRLAGFEHADLILAPVNAAGQDHDATYRWLEKLEKERADHERARLLYVAATRARRMLHLFGNVKTRLTPDGAQLTAPRRGSMLHLLWDSVKSAYESAFAAHDGFKAFTSSAREVIALRRLPLNWNMPAKNDDFAAPVQLQFVIHEADEELLFDWVTQTARHAGTLVHRELQRLTRLPSGQTLEPAAQRARYLFELAELGVPIDHRAATVDRVIAALTRTLADERGQWILQSRHANFDAASELALSGVVNGEVVSIVIDRTFVDEEGARWIVDYKTSTHEGADLEEFLSSEVQRYTPQLARYAQLMRSYKSDQPIRTALYFPMLGKWREVVLS